MSSVTVADGSTVLFWKDCWNGAALISAYPELFSFAKNGNIYFKAASSSTQFIQNFNIPLSVQAHHQFIDLQGIIQNREITVAIDQWKYGWGSTSFSTSKAYKVLKAGARAHPVFQWIWRSKCQMKHKVFFWLLLKDRLGTRDMLRRKNMILDSYTCDLCIWQRPETNVHLFLRCNFAEALLGFSWNFLYLHQINAADFQKKSKRGWKSPSSWISSS
jgi:hypothetical protein